MYPDGELLTQVVNPQHNDYVVEEMRRKVVVDGKTGVWKRFVVLCNVDGQKYTIGRTFTSREEQGEFIFLDRQQLDKIAVKGNALCEISCVQNKYWVEMGDNPIFINGDKIVARTELKFEDILSFREKSIARQKYDEGHEIVRFLFKERELIPEAFHYSVSRFRLNVRQDVRTAQNEAAFRAAIQAAKNGIRIQQSKCKEETDPDNCKIMVGLNPLILSHILSFLPVSEVKHTRLVSQLWNAEANTIIRKRSVGVVKFGCQPTQFFRYLQDTRLNPNNLPHWEIYIPLFTGPRFGTSKPGSDLDWFLQSRIHVVSSLNLDGRFESQAEFDIRIQILQQLHETLEDLTLSGQWIVQNPGEVIYQFPTILKFPKLQKFTLSLSVFTIDGELIVTADTLEWVLRLIEAVSGVRSICLKTGHSLTLIFLSKLNSFPNLEEISLGFTTPSALDWLLNIDTPLRKLELNQLDIVTQEENAWFDLLLEKHSKTLTKLQFIFPATQGMNCHFLPAFPNLRELSVGRMQIPRNTENQDNNGQGRVETKIVFGRRMDLIYERIFPRLQSLSLNPEPFFDSRWNDIAGVWERHADFFNNFFPSDIVIEGLEFKAPKQICRTLVQLKLPAACGRPEQIFPRAGELSEMFPGVHNEWMNKVRVTEADLRFQ